ncbi:MAG: response regulator transcription factor [Polyangiaceae bacterium]|nr:response regulator transcription factor [Polyangiaceae bacterium]
MKPPPPLKPPPPPPRPPPRPLPKRAALAPGPAPGAAAEPSTATPTRGNLPRIVVADDDNEIRTLLKRALERHYDVVLASDGPGVVALASRQPYPELFLLDVMMPGMDGFEVAAQIRALPHGKRVPIMFLTARDSPMDRIRGIQAGARSYLVKPFKLEELMAKVKSVIGR